MIAVLLLSQLGCERRTPGVYVLSPAVAKLEPQLQEELQSALEEFSGTHLQPKLLGSTEVSPRQLKHGQQLYETNCAQCHGVTGDGAGPAAVYMYPRPRDYRKGVFKFTSTPYGYRPQRSDLLRIVARGIRGTSMPGFSQLADEEREAIVDYVLALTHRGELEQQLLEMAEFDEEIDREAVADDLIPNVLNRWNDAAGSEVLPLTSQPVFTLEHVERGRQAFLDPNLGCFKCHGEDGRGQTPDNLAGNLRDAWGNPTRAADLTGGILRGGQLPRDIYQRIFSGINGTPMPGFANALRDEPERGWDLVAYVMHITNARRMGDKPVPGPISPYIPAGVQAEAAGDTESE
mgnify:CR=1 FL=1